MKIISLTWQTTTDWSADTSYLDQEGFEDRKEQYQQGDFGFIGVYAVAEVVVAGTSQTIKSPGLWSIEDDSDTAYLAEVGQEEMDQLKAILLEMGADPADLAA